MKILLVDDEKLALEHLDKCVKQVGNHTTTACSTPSEAIRVSENDTFDAALIDITMPEMNGIELATKLQAMNDRLNIIFCTGYDEYMPEAFDIHASGYIMKPVSADKIRHELDNLRIPVAENSNDDKLKIQCFGLFDVTSHGEPIMFKYKKSKEVLAYLIDQKGSLCSSDDISAILWNDKDDHSSYLRNVRKDLLDSLSKHGHGNVIANYHGSLRININSVSCDYFDWIRNYRSEKYNGEYMEQYSWAENTRNFIRLHNVTSE